MSITNPLLLVVLGLVVLDVQMWVATKPEDQGRVVIIGRQQTILHKE